MKDSSLVTPCSTISCRTSRAYTAPRMRVERAWRAGALFIMEPGAEEADAVGLEAGGTGVEARGGAGMEESRAGMEGEPGQVVGAGEG